MRLGKNPTPQRIFDSIAHHLFKQGEQSKDNDICAYRGPNGKKCAIGAVLPNKCYNEDMEGLTINELIHRNKLIHSPGLPQFFYENVDLLDDLQSAHDEDSYWKNTKVMQSTLEEIAIHHNLSMDYVKTLKF